MVSQAQTAVLDYMKDRPIIQDPGDVICLTYADIWTLHLGECHQHGKSSCVFDNCIYSVRALVDGEDAAAHSTSRRQVATVVREIAVHKVRTKYGTVRVSDANAGDFASRPFRLRAASPLWPAAAAAAGGDTAPSPVALDLRGLGAPTPHTPAFAPKRGDVVKVLSDTSPRFNCPEGHATVLRRTESGFEVSFIQGFGIRKPIVVAADKIAPPDNPQRWSEHVQLRRAHAARADEAAVLEKRLGRERAAAAETVDGLKSELRKRTREVESLFRGNGLSRRGLDLRRRFMEAGLTQSEAELQVAADRAANEAQHERARAQRRTEFSRAECWPRLRSTRRSARRGERSGRRGRRRRSRGAALCLRWPPHPSTPATSNGCSRAAGGRC
jgi:hypothetical protein